MEVWVICTHELNRLIGFVKTGAHCATRYTITLEPDQAGSSIQWQQEVTSLDIQGDTILEETTVDAYRKRMEHINNMLEYYLQNGIPLQDL